MELVGTVGCIGVGSKTGRRRLVRGDQTRALRRAFWHLQGFLASEAGMQVASAGVDVGSRSGTEGACVLGQRYTKRVGAWE